MFFVLASAILALFAVHVAAADATSVACANNHSIEEELDELFEVSLLQTHISIVEPKSSAHRERHDSTAGSVEAQRKRPENSMQTLGSTSLLQLSAAHHRARTYFSSMLPWGSANSSFTVRIAALASFQVPRSPVEQYHWTLLMVICCLALTIFVAALSHKAKQQKGVISDWLPKSGLCGLEQQPLTVDSLCLFRPAKTMGLTAALKVRDQYNVCPEECLHEGGLRTYTARKQSFKICDQCGSRWMLQKDTCGYVPIAPRAEPADPE